MVENNLYSPDLDFYVKEFLSIGWNRKSAVQLKPYMLNPFLKILETMGRECLVEMKNFKDLKGSTQEGYYYLVYPKICGTNKNNPDTVLGIDYIKNPYKQ